MTAQQKVIHDTTNDKEQKFKKSNIKKMMFERELTQGDSSSAGDIDTSSLEVKVNLNRS